MAGRSDDRGFGGYDSPQEWREATFGDVRKTWNPVRQGGFAGYANVSDWERATFGTHSRSSVKPSGSFHPRCGAHEGYEEVAHQLPPGETRPLSFIEKIALRKNDTISYLRKLNDRSFGRAAIVSEFASDKARDQRIALEKLFTPERMLDLAQAHQIKELDKLCWFPVAIKALRHDAWRQNPDFRQRYEDLGSGFSEGHDIQFTRRVVACAVPVQIASSVQHLLQAELANTGDFFARKERADNYREVARGCRKREYSLIQNLTPGNFVTSEELAKIATITELETKKLEIPLEQFVRRRHDPSPGISGSPLNFFCQRSFTDREMFDDSFDYRIDAGMVLDGIRNLASLPGPQVSGLVWFGNWTSLEFM